MIAALPDGFSPEFFILPEQITNKHAETLFIPEAFPNMRGVDCNLYYPSDVSQGQHISGNHSHVYIEGNLGANARINVRQGIVSAHSLEPGSEVNCGSIVVVEDLPTSLKSLNLSKHPHEPLIIQVPPGKRKEVFLELVNDPRISGEYEKRMAHLSEDAIDAMSDEEFMRHRHKAMGAYVGHVTSDEALDKALDSLRERGLIINTSRTAHLAASNRDAGEKLGR